MTHKAKVLALLSDGCYHSYREGYALNVMLHSRVADLRRDGYVIECKKHTGGYWYRLLSKPGLAQGPRRRLQGEAVTDEASTVASALPDGLPGANDGADCLADAQGPGDGGTAALSPAPLPQSGGADGLTAVPAGHTAGASAPPEPETLTERGEQPGECSSVSGASPRSVSAFEDAAAGVSPVPLPALTAAQPSLFDMPKVAPWA